MYNNMFLIFILSILALVELMDIPDRNAYKIFSGIKRGFKDLLISKKLNNFQNDLSPRLLSNNLVSAKAMKSSLNIFNLISDKMILEKILNAKISEGLKSDDINFKKACKSFNADSQNMPRVHIVTLLNHIEKSLKGLTTKEIKAQFDILANRTSIKYFFAEVRKILEKEEDDDCDNERCQDICEEEISDDEESEYEIDRSESESNMMMMMMMMMMMIMMMIVMIVKMKIKMLMMMVMMI